MKIICYFILGMLTMFMVLGCEIVIPDPPVESQYQGDRNGGGPGGNTGGGGNCGTGYKGPTGDIQSDAFCQAAWNYRCHGQTVQANANCIIYKQLQEDNPGLPNCPYCP